MECATRNGKVMAEGKIAVTSKYVCARRGVDREVVIGVAIIQRRVGSRSGPRIFNRAGGGIFHKIERFIPDQPQGAVVRHAEISCPAQINGMTIREKSARRNSESRI